MKLPEYLVECEMIGVQSKSMRDDLIFLLATKAPVREFEIHVTPGG